MRCKNVLCDAHNDNEVKNCCDFVKEVVKICKLRKKYDKFIKSYELMEKELKKIAMNDRERIDLLEDFMINNKGSNGLALMPLNNCSKFSIDDLGSEDGSNLSDELCEGETLRDAIDNLKPITERVK